MTCTVNFFAALLAFVCIFNQSVLLRLNKKYLTKQSTLGMTAKYWFVFASTLCLDETLMWDIGRNMMWWHRTSDIGLLVIFKQKIHKSYSASHQCHRNTWGIKENQLFSVSKDIWQHTRPRGGKVCVEINVHFIKYNSKFSLLVLYESVSNRQINS